MNYELRKWPLHRRDPIDKNSSENMIDAEILLIMTLNSKKVKVTSIGLLADDIKNRVFPKEK